MKIQAEILAGLVKALKYLDELMQDKKILDVIQTCKRFVMVLSKKKMLAYLETGRLVQVALEKFDQELVFQLLSLFLAK